MTTLNGTIIVEGRLRNRNKISLLQGPSGVLGIMVLQGWHMIQ